MSCKHHTARWNWKLRIRNSGSRAHIFMDFFCWISPPIILHCNKHTGEPLKSVGNPLSVVAEVYNKPIPHQTADPWTTVAHHSPAARHCLLAAPKGSGMEVEAVVLGADPSCLLTLCLVVRYTHETCAEMVTFHFPSQRRPSTCKGCSVAAVFQYSAPLRYILSVSSARRPAVTPCVPNYYSSSQDGSPFHFYFTVFVLTGFPWCFLWLYGALT